MGRKVCRKGQRKRGSLPRVGVFRDWREGVPVPLPQTPVWGSDPGKSCTDCGLVCGQVVGSSQA